MDLASGASARTMPPVDPGLEMASMLAEAAAAIRLALNYPELKALARLSLIGHVLDDLAPGPQAGGGPLPAPLPCSGPDEAARDIAATLRAHPAPATAILERYAGEPLRLKNRTEVTREPADTERLRLHTRRGDRVYDRTGDLITLSGVTAARVRLVVVPALLPADVAEGLDGDLPFGALCAGRLARRARAAEVTGRDPAVAATALLAVDGQLAGYACEEIPRSFCEHTAVTEPTYPQPSVTARSR